MARHKDEAKRQICKKAFVTSPKQSADLKTMTSDEERARQAVRDRFACVKNVRELFDPEGIRKSARYFIRLNLIENLPDRAETIVKKARGGDHDAHFVIQRLACDLIKVGEPLPEPLLGYHLDVCEGRQPQPAKTTKHDSTSLWWRDWMIAGVVAEALPFVVSERRACQIVCDVLAELGVAISSENIRTIWKKSATRRDIGKLGICSEWGKTTLS